MSKSYDFELQLTCGEYSALLDIRGLKSRAHMMVMCASLQDNGDRLIQGSHDDFDDLLSDVDLEIEERIAPKKNLPALRRIRKYITPTDDSSTEW